MAKESIDAIAQTRTDLAARIYIVAMEEAKWRACWPNGHDGALG